MNQNREDVLAANEGAIAAAVIQGGVRGVQAREQSKATFMRRILRKLGKHGAISGAFGNWSQSFNEATRKATPAAIDLADGNPAATAEGA